MLTLSRREGERLMIGDDIVIEIKRVRGNQVSIGIKAPDHVAVHREEIFRAIEADRVQKWPDHTTLSRAGADNVDEFNRLYSSNFSGETS